MIEDRLKTGLWVQAQVRMGDINMMAVMVRRRGDADAGVVVLVLDRLDGTAEVFSQAREMDGSLAWVRGVGDGPVALADVEAYVAEQVRFDPDIWVLDVEDPKARYELDAPLMR